MDSSVIAKLTALLAANPGLKEQLMSIRSIDDAVALVKTKGLEIAAKELQEYMVKNLASSAISKGLGGLAGGNTADIAGSVLKGIFGK